MSHHGGIARTFVDARLRDAVLRAYPGPLPQSLAEAYQIQAEAIAYAGRAVGGWKLGRIRWPEAGVFGAERLAGPIFSDAISFPDSAEPVAMQVLTGFAAVEAEILLRLSAAPPPDISVEGARDFVDQVRFGIEIASSPFVGINQNGPAVTVSDFGNNFGLVVGPLIPDAKAPGGLDRPVALAIDGVTIGEGLVADMLDGPFGSLAFLARLMAERGMPLEAGQWISSGAITGVHPVRQGQHVRATFGDDIAIECTTTPALLPEGAQ
ncbi:2-keto-4-pentenoate hydratase [Erythrobacter donghaensis]|uniref:2-keto-4-pentenoate hydratase n=1 Tax=Erythrobacter donghaensis TaxID=267135 RepID=UPI000A3CFBE7|nr:fumarylacetoacetate hydrolase family protein [Erythrobacter donghaensis]